MPSGFQAFGSAEGYVGSHQPVATVATISPPIGPLAGQAVTITGTHFTGATGVTVNGGACTSLVVVNDSTITCVVPVLTQALGDVVVTTGGGPSTLTNGYAALDMASWFRADLGITNVSGKASAWADQGGNKNATQATSGKRPTINASVAAYNNQATLGFASASSQIMHTAAYDAALTQAITMVIVANADGTTGVQEFLDGLSTRSIISASEGIVNRYEGYSGSFISAASTGPVDALPHLIAFEGNGASSKVYFDAITEKVTANAGTNGLDGLSIGGSPTDTATLNGQIAEVLVIRGVLSVSLRTFLFNYTGTRYGLTIGA